jgi:hypothetical protein
MSSVVQRPSILTRLRARLQIVLLRLLQRIILSRHFRVILGPVLLVWAFVWACRVAFGRSPVIKIPACSAITPELAEVIAKIEEARRAPVKAGMTERGRDIVQTMTWGTAGAAVLILLNLLVKFSAERQVCGDPPYQGPVEGRVRHRRVAICESIESLDPADRHLIRLRERTYDSAQEH